MDKHHSFHLSHARSWITEKDMVDLDAALLQSFPRVKTEEEEGNACKELPRMDVKVEQFCNFMSQLVGREKENIEPNIACSSTTDYVSNRLRPRSYNLKLDQPANRSLNFPEKVDNVPEEALVVPEESTAKIDTETDDSNDKSSPSLSVNRTTLHTLNFDSQHITKNVLFCKRCNRQFAHLYALTVHKKSKLHMRMKHGFACDICKRKVLTKDAFQTHMKMHDKKGNFRCGECSKEFIYEVDLRKDEVVGHNIKSLTCSVCTKLFLTTDNLKRHEEGCGKKSVECDVCRKTFQQQAYLKIHKLSHSEDRPYECDICGHKCKTADLLKKHLKIHNPEKHFPCMKCEKKFSNLHNLRLHQCEAVENRGFSPGLKPFMCTVCQEGFVEKLSLVEHMEMHGNRGKDLKKKSTCIICGLELSSPWKLKKHEKAVHFIQKPFSCGLCEEKFETGSDHSKHKKTAHAQEHRYMCGICRKTFPLLQRLEHHVAIHSDERPFKCTTCDSCFKRKTHLEAHSVGHSGGKNYKCQHCEKRFFYNYQLQVHLKTHDGIKRFNCVVCDKGFFHKKDMEVHSYTHSKEKRFKCPQCDAGFSTKSYLLKHLMKQH